MLRRFNGMSSIDVPFNGYEGGGGGGPEGGGTVGQPYWLLTLLTSQSVRTREQHEREKRALHR